MKGILFTEQMFNAVIEGRKLKTRRIIKSKYDGKFCDITKHNFGVIIHEFSGNNKIGRWPRYYIGETVYLKEPYIDDIAIEKIFYKFDKSDRQEAIDCGFDYGWKNKLFMPESCARYFIKITNVRCERVHQISESDCIAEGIFPMIDPIGIPGFGYDKNHLGFMWSKAKYAFRELWKSINGKRSWIESPYVFVYEFQLL